MAERVLMIEDDESLAVMVREYLGVLSQSCFFESVGICKPLNS